VAVAMPVAAVVAVVADNAVKSHYASCLTYITELQINHL
jgi:hypothetical protein